MRRIILTIIFSVFIISISIGREKRINLYGGYVFDDKFESHVDAYDYYDGKIKGGLQYGGGLEFKSFSDFGLELVYLGQTTTAPTHHYDKGDENTVYDLQFNYALLALNKYFLKDNSKKEIYAGFLVGALFVNVADQNSSFTNDATKFSWAVRVGGNYWLGEKVGIKLQTQLLSSVQSAGGEIYFGSGSAGTGVTTLSSMLQFSVSTGLVFRFGEAHSSQ